MGASCRGVGVYVQIARQCGEEPLLRLVRQRQRATATVVSVRATDRGGPCAGAHAFAICDTRCAVPIAPVRMYGPRDTGLGM
jgi:hypothetical protein